jgi:predicted TIM-barrel fold metal-dependent hydrolase
VRIVCIEEHTIDAATAKASGPGMAAEAAYMADWGSRVEDRPEEYDDNRPHLVAPGAATDTARDLGAGRIADMDRHGIDMQIISFASVPQLAPAEMALDLTRAANNRLAEAVRAHSTRFGGFAMLPWQRPDDAAAELERAVRQLGMKGTLLMGRPGDTFLDDERYSAVLAKLEQLEVPIYLHPGFPLPHVRAAYYGGLEREVSARFSMFGWGWHHEAGIQVLRMILAGTFERFPRLQVISGHWGEMVPFYLQRMDDTLPRQVTGLPRSISDTYRAHVYVTPSGMLNLPHFEFIRRVVGADRIMYSVDYPYLTQMGARSFLQGLRIGEDEREKIAHGNAEALLQMDRPHPGATAGTTPRHS